MMSDISLTDVQVTNDYFINAQDSKNLQIHGINFDGLRQGLIRFKDSVVESIHNVNISNGVQVFSFIRSEIKNISNSNFRNNTSPEKGGVVSISDSKVNINNSTFTSNSAKIGGSLSFECISLDN